MGFLTASTPAVLHDVADCPEAIRHEDTLVEVSVDDSVGLMNTGQARPCGACVGRAPSIGHLLDADE